MPQSEAYASSSATYYLTISKIGGCLPPGYVPLQFRGVRALGRPRVGVDLEPASGSLLAVELTCGLFLLGRRKLDVSDALEVSRLPVGRQAHVADGSVLGKGLGELPPDLLLAQVLVKALDE